MLVGKPQLPNAPGIPLEATRHGDPQAEAAAIETLLLTACQNLGLAEAPHPHNPNLDHKHHPTYLIDTC